MSSVPRDTAPGSAPPRPITVPHIRSRKQGGRRIVMLTAYDCPTARLLDQAGVDIILVGDSLANTVLGYDSTLPVTMDEMLHHARAVVRGTRHALVVGDMPYMSYQTGTSDAIRNAGRFLKEAGAAAVKIEGGRKRAGLVRALREAEVPVMGHIGLTPQSLHVMGGYRVQGKKSDDVRALVDDARALQEAGAFALVLEGMPAPAARAVSEAIDVPTIGIGAGPDCDGQVLVFHDLVGLTEGTPPRFVRRYAAVGEVIADAARRFIADVREGSFPSAAETYPVPSPVRTPARGAGN